jgi:hypothetical protein
LTLTAGTRSERQVDDAFRITQETRLGRPLLPSQARVHLRFVQPLKLSILQESLPTVVTGTAKKVTPAPKNILLAGSDFCPQVRQVYRTLGVTGSSKPHNLSLAKALDATKSQTVDEQTPRI